MNSIEKSLHFHGALQLDDELKKHRYWQVHHTKSGEQLGIFDSANYEFFSSELFWRLDSYLKRTPYVQIQYKDISTRITLESETGLMWSMVLGAKYRDSHQAAAAKLEGLAAYGGLQGWRLPDLYELLTFAKDADNPHRTGIGNALQTANGQSQDLWLYDKGALDLTVAKVNPSDALLFQQMSSDEEPTEDQSVEPLDDQSEGLSLEKLEVFERLVQELEKLEVFERLAQDDHKVGAVFACNDFFQSEEADGIQGKKLWSLLLWLYRSNFQLPNFQFQGSKKYTDMNVVARLREWTEEKFFFIQPSKNTEPAQTLQIRPEDFMTTAQSIIKKDYISCRLPELNLENYPGIWELWGKSQSDIRNAGAHPRNPQLDVQHNRVVGVDFGTSSTVVAITSVEGGKPELLRLGLEDQFAQINAKQFENPTILEVLDYRSFARIWCSQAQRPALNWNWMRSSHAAQATMTDNLQDQKTLSRLLPRLKQWALRSEKDNQIRLLDSLGYSLDLPVHTDRTLVKGKPLSVSHQDPFDPIELYAWYLGMYINTRQRGIFLNYQLSFPVKYPLEVRNRMLSSFKRGIMRSLPKELFDEDPDTLHNIKVERLTSEPTAYAASALRYLGVEPTEQGVPYAVFDMGGGTSDFDFGLLRWANEDEEDLGYEVVVEHLHSEGDNFLGGENLVDWLVYEVFKANLDKLRRAQVQFTRPMGADNFVGHEAFISDSPLARTNTLLAAKAMRHFMEASHIDHVDDEFSVTLLDIHGEKQDLDLQMDVQALDQLLAQRIRAGILVFLKELAVVRDRFPAGQTIQLLLAGNGCKSRHIQAMFNPDGPQWKQLMTEVFGENNPEIAKLLAQLATQDPEAASKLSKGRGWPDIRKHDPLPMHPTDPSAPSAKTGVALGLLELCKPSTKLIDDEVQDVSGEALFGWFVGRAHRGIFKPAIERGAAYGQWVDVGRSPQGEFLLLVSSSPRSTEGLPETSGEVKVHRLSFPGAPAPAKIWARPVGPNSLELTATDKDSVAPDPAAAVQKLELK